MNIVRAPIPEPALQSSMAAGLAKALPMCGEVSRDLGSRHYS